MKNKTQQLNRKIAIVIALVASASLMCAFSTTDTPKNDRPKEKKPAVAFAHVNPQPDSVVIVILGEDVSNIVFGSKKATLSHLNPMEPPTDNDETIGGVKVINTLGTLNKTDLITMQFLMADSAFYNLSNPIVTSPYAPSYALTFYKGKQKIDLLFSLQSSEMGIVINGKLSKVVRYHNARMITRFIRLVSQNEFYDKIIENQ